MKNENKKSYHNLTSSSSDEIAYKLTVEFYDLNLKENEFLKNKNKIRKSVMDIISAKDYLNYLDFEGINLSLDVFEIILKNEADFIDILNYLSSNLNDLKTKYDEILVVLSVKQNSVDINFKVIVGNTTKSILKTKFDVYRQNKLLKKYNFLFNSSTNKLELIKN